VFAVRSLLRALSKIFKHLKLQVEILQHLSQYQTEAGVYYLVDFFRYAIDNHEH
jgi:hypothetical protein